jgi:hypothetical protein
VVEGGGGGFGVEFMVEIVSTDAGVLLINCLGPFDSNSAGILKPVGCIAFG